MLPLAESLVGRRLFRELPLRIPGKVIDLIIITKKVVNRERQTDQP